MGHMETSLFEQCGYSREAIQARLERNWYEMFEARTRSTGRTTKAWGT